MNGDRDWKRYALNGAICVPSIFLISYLLYYAASSLSAVDIGIIMIPFFAKRLLPSGIGKNVYHISILIFLLLVLGTLYQVGIGPDLWVIRWLKIPLTFTTLTSVLFTLALILILEAILSEKATYTLGEYVGSLLILMQQLAVITVMLSPVFADMLVQAAPALYSYGLTNPTPYESAYFVTVSLEADSFYNLLVYGYQQYLPLAIASTPVDTVMIVLFVISAIAILITLYMRENHRTMSRLGMLGSYVVIGVLLAAVVLFLVQELEYTSYQILIIAGSTAIMLVIAGYTSFKVPGNETINSPIK